MQSEYLKMGERFAELRKVLSRDSGEEWTQPRLAKKLRVSQEVIHRLERGSGSIENLAKLVEFYHDKGFNMRWVMAADNSSIGMYRDKKAL